MVEVRQRRRVAETREARDDGELIAALEARRVGAADDSVNLMPMVIWAARARATQGEMVEVYREQPRV